MKKKLSLTEQFAHLKSTPRVYRDRGETTWMTEDGKFHRIGGPAQEFENGDKISYVNGLRHNETGPAIDLADGRKFYYLEGKELSAKAFAKRTGKTPSTP